MIATDIAAARHAHLLAALLDHETPPWRPGELPPLGHWLLFPPDARQSAMGVDGHPARADDSLSRRMWAGGRLRFIAPVPLGAQVQRTTEILSETDKEGRSGRMKFVTLSHRLTVDGAPVIEEEQDIVYREAATPGASARPAPPGNPTTPPAVARRMQAGPVDLFRFSALTFNAHRIHYDRDYAMSQEGYPALVVHGPYIATLLMDHYLRHRPAAPVRGFSFRAQRPIFDTDPFTLGLVEDEGGANLMAIDAAGGVAMQARIDL
ncbi:FAS1-like dehydratase domain-containing protein [Sphingobium aromaticivastans]|uniref:FAS1-like dehydratase domain-containing protein n=1 Tax=Sphingobium aromaticivastans TaxID=1778665 RepID=UPI00301618D5